MNRRPPAAVKSFGYHQFGDGYNLFICLSRKMNRYLCLLISAILFFHSDVSGFDFSKNKRLNSDDENHKIKKSPLIDIQGTLTLNSEVNKDLDISYYSPSATMSGTTTVCKNDVAYITFTGSGGVAP
ncbi:MAG: hypothetical protein KGO92_09755, partial [Bacteroidota bacterium]|nr:hypothetical protein [Bacteroidota bacterium]